MLLFVSMLHACAKFVMNNSLLGYTCTFIAYIYSEIVFISRPQSHDYVRVLRWYEKIEGFGRYKKAYAFTPRTARGKGNGKEI